MLYLIAILLPPLSLLLIGKVGQAILSIPLTMCFWVPGVVHAMVVIGSHQADKRAKGIERAVRESAMMNMQRSEK